MTLIPERGRSDPVYAGAQVAVDPGDVSTNHQPELEPPGTAGMPPELRKVPASLRQRTISKQRLTSQCSILNYM